MRRLLFLLVLLGGFAAPHAYAQPTQQGILLDIQGAIGPATAEYVHSGFEQAQLGHASFVILQLDTPGGLDRSMRDIIRDIISSPVPVIAYVAPGGARAASAGTYILYASQIAAMAPGTNLGAATPVGIGSQPKSDAMEQKAKNDASAYIRSLAQLRNRNAGWAEKAVNQAASLSAEEALKQNVIDVIAKDIPDLLQQINGRTIEMQGAKINLQTTGATVVQWQADWHAKLLSIITDPNIAYILMIIGIWGLFFEFAHPGAVLPGVTGAICLLVALYAFQLLPISFVGLGLILLGMACMVAEAFLPTFGALGIGGVIAFIIGSLMLLGPHTPGFAIALPLIVAVSIVSAGFFLLIVNMAIKARFRPIVSGREQLIGKTAVVALEQDGTARVHIHGEWWQVRSSKVLLAGQRVKIVGIEGVVLLVE